MLHTYIDLILPINLFDSKFLCVPLIITNVSFQETIETKPSRLPSHVNFVVYEIFPLCL